MTHHLSYKPLSYPLRTVAPPHLRCPPSQFVYTPFSWLADLIFSNIGSVIEESADLSSTSCKGMEST